MNRPTNDLLTLARQLDDVLTWARQGSGMDWMGQVEGVADHLRRKVAADSLDAAPTWEQRVSLASISIVNTTQRITDADTRDERKEARLYAAEQALRAAFPEYAP